MGGALKIRVDYAAGSRLWGTMGLTDNATCAPGQKGQSTDLGGRERQGEPAVWLAMGCCRGA